MDSSMTLLTANIEFLDTRLALIHIPLHLYRNFLQSILQLLLPNVGTHEVENLSGAVQPPTSLPSEQPFLNISVTPIECSVVCSRALATELFAPVLLLMDAESRSQVHITSEDFVVMQVDGEGLDAGQRVLELTSPLALAGIPIFFITTYFSDYILVPFRHQAHVVRALEERGFQFQDDTSSYVNAYHYSRKSSASSFIDIAPPSNTNTNTTTTTASQPTTLSDLQTHTFATLARCNIVPTISSHLRLVQCAARKTPTPHHSHRRTTTTTPTPTTDPTLHLALIKCLITPQTPTFLSLTLTATEPASLLLDHTLLPLFPADVLLLGAQDELLVPIALDLRGLPMESTGIVCGVAGRLMGMGGGVGLVEMSYLSTARAGTVMVGEAELERALRALRGAGMGKGMGGGGTVCVE